MATVLIVDDTDAILFFVTKLLTKRIAGLNVLSASTCDDARRVAHEQHLDGCIVDWYLPDGDGIALLDELRTAAPGAFLFLVSAAVDPTVSKLATDRGATGVFSKPFDPVLLVDAIRQQLPPRPGDATQS